MENEIKDNENLIMSELLPIYQKRGIKERLYQKYGSLGGIHNIVGKVSEIILDCQAELLIALPEVAENIAKPAQPMLRTLYREGG